jgi:hypothetical protein
MNVKLEEGALRFRISDEELRTLLQGYGLSVSLTIAGKTLSAFIVPGDPAAGFSPLYEQDNIRLQVPPEKLKELERLGRSRDGIFQECGGVLVSLQVDFRTQKKE